MSHSNPILTFEMTFQTAQQIHKLISADLEAHKNWLVTKVENDDFEGAKKLIKEIRTLKRLFADFNVEVKKDLADKRGVPMETKQLVG